MDYQIIHTTIGRFRIRVPHLANNPQYARRLDWLVACLDFVTDVRINVKTGSLIIHYEAGEVLSGTVLESIFKAIRQASISEIPHSYLLLER
jgi:Heavy metal associated domain 2